MKKLFESGATSHAVNDLILFADNTEVLAKLRDKIYMRAFDFNDIIRSTFKVEGESSGKNVLKNAFSELLRETIKTYIKEFPKDHNHIKNIKHWDEQGNEFCQLYVNDFDNWKLEHGIKSK